MTYYVVNNGSFQCIDNKVQICREGLPKIVSSNVPTFIEVVGPMKIVDKNPVVITKKTSTGKYNSYYTVHICLLYKSKIIWIFYGKFADEGDNPVDKTNIYNV